MISKDRKIRFLKSWMKNDSSNQEPRFESSQMWSRRLLWSIISAVSIGFIYSSIVRIDEVVTTIGELQAEGAERPIKSPLSGLTLSGAGKDSYSTAPTNLPKNIGIMNKEYLKALID